MKKLGYSMRLLYEIMLSKRVKNLHIIQEKDTNMSYINTYYEHIYEVTFITSINNKLRVSKPKINRNKKKHNDIS